MKKVFVKTLAVTLAFTVTFALLTAMAPKKDEGETSKGTLSVNGSGVIKADPDIASLSLAVEITELEAADAQKKVAEAIENVMKALKKQGIKDADIQTSSYSINKEYDYTTYYSYTITPDTEPKELGYTVYHALSVTVRDIEKVGEVLDAAVEAGINQTYGIYFTIEDQEAFYMEALKLAMENAEKKAGAMADILGVTIGAPASVSESSSGYFSPVYMDSSAYRTYSEAEASYGAYDTSISSGQIEVTAYIYVLYEYLY